MVDGGEDSFEGLGVGGFAGDGEGGGGLVGLWVEGLDVDVAIEDADGFVG